jgi:methylated-DNA-[protein]-cysteine S-methyltransferase
VGCIPRAMGRACGTNPIPVIIPCHRVLAAAGAPGGYSGAGGLATKRFLLDLERGRAGEALRRSPVQFQLPLAR